MKRKNRTDEEMDPDYISPRDMIRAKRAEDIYEEKFYGDYEYNQLKKQKELEDEN